MNLNHLHDSFFFTNTFLLILYDVYATFEKIGKNTQFFKKNSLKNFAGIQFRG